MSDSKAAENQTGRPTVPRTKQFRRKPSSTLPTPEQLRRQDAALRSAWQNLRESGPVITFLNSHNERLGGQPLHIAIGSDAGLLRVEVLLDEIGQGLAPRL